MPSAELVAAVGLFAGAGLVAAGVLALLELELEFPGLLLEFGFELEFPDAVEVCPVALLESLAEALSSSISVSIGIAAGSFELELSDVAPTEAESPGGALSVDLLLAMKNFLLILLLIIYNCDLS